MARLDPLSLEHWDHGSFMSAGLRPGVLMAVDCLAPGWRPALRSMISALRLAGLLEAWHRRYFCAVRWLPWLAALGCAVGVSLEAPTQTRAGESPWAGGSFIVDRGALPRRVHVFEDYETDIERRWWLRGVLETNNVPPGLSASVANRRACRAAATKDFDDKLGDLTKAFKGVVFNPVPGPPMGANTRLSFRYWLKGTDTLRVQIYSLSKGFHRSLRLTHLPEGSWQSVVVEMTQARRPDGSGGALAEDERIDDIQFYIAPEAELVIDDIVLYEAAPAGEKRPFPGRLLFTGWFDTGKQGAEWRGEFNIVPHDPPQTWKAAKSVLDPQTGQPWIRLQLRGARPLGAFNHVRFLYRLHGGNRLQVVLSNSGTRQEWGATAPALVTDRWAETTVELGVDELRASADELRFLAPKESELLVDDVLLFEPVVHNFN